LQRLFDEYKRLSELALQQANVCIYRRSTTCRATYRRENEKQTCSRDQQVVYIHERERQADMQYMRENGRQTYIHERERQADIHT
jgi:hypothetical protein